MAQKLSIPGFEDAGADHFHLVNKYLNNEEHGPRDLLVDNADEAGVPPDAHQNFNHMDIDRQGTSPVTCLGINNAPFS